MTILYVIVLVPLLAAGWYLIPFGFRWLSSQRLRRYCREQGAIVLTYDDGPSGRLLPRLLELLAQHDVQATFFLLGRNAVTKKDAARLLLEGGHEVGSHTFDHSNAWKTWPWRAARDLAKGLKSLRDLGAPSNVFRPPYGKATLVTLLDCRLRRVRVGWWTIDSRDVWNRRPIDDVLSELETHGGGVVLMHDLDVDETATDGLPHSDYVIDLTRDIISFAKKSGLRLRRLGDVYDTASG